MPPKHPPQQTRGNGAAGDDGTAEAPSAHSGTGAPQSQVARRKRRGAEDLPSVGALDILDDKYQLVHTLDEGGMGSVYAAQNMVLGVPVAIKVIRADARGPAKKKLSARLLQEAHAAAKIVHPAVVRVLDLGQAPNGDPYLVMELLTGDDLANVLDEKGEIDAVKTVRTLLPIAHGLAAAHDKKVVHRDLKPENILLAEKEGGGIQPKIIDFGLAKTRIPRRKRLTQVGDAFGTPDYMSPEQMRGEDVTAQADIWAFCVLLYEMITGRPPFEGDNFRIVMRRIMEADPVPCTTLGAGDDDLWAIIEKGLAKQTARRWKSMRDVGTALARWLIDQGVTEDIAGGSLDALWIRPPQSSGVADVFASVPPPPERQAAAPLMAPSPPSSTPQVAIAPAPPSSTPYVEAVVDSGRAPLSAEPPMSVPAPSAPVSTAAVAQAVAAAGAAPAARKRTGSSVLLILLWLVALVGIAGAITGYLQISLPGVPARIPTPAAWPWTRAANPASPAPVEAPSTTPKVADTGQAAPTASH